MTIQYKDATEAGKVDAQAKKTKPTYYNAELKKKIPISDDLEAALILLPANAKQQCQQALTAQLEQVERVQKRDSILKAALKVEFDNASAQVSELTQSLNQFQGFKQQFQTYASVAEIGTILRDAQVGNDEKVLAFDRALNRKVMAAILTERVENNTASDDVNKERQELANVLIEYLS